MLATILAALALSVPTHCVWTQPAWEVVTARVGTSPEEAAAFYLPTSLGGPRVFIGPTECMNLRELTRRHWNQTRAWRGVWVLAHEYGHVLQERAGRPFNEHDADLYADRHVRKWVRVLRAVLLKGPGDRK